MPQKDHYPKKNLQHWIRLVVFKIKQMNWGNITFFSVVLPFLLYFLFVFLTIDMSVEGNWTKYTDFVYRIGFFFLTSIVSLTIFGSNFKTKLASATAFQQKSFYFMASGITGSILMVITIFIANIEIKFGFTAFYIQVSKFLFLSVLIIFFFILYDFLCSFWINFTLKRNLKGLQKFGSFKQTQNINNNSAILFLTDKKAEKLTEYIEMYVQNLVFLMNTKNDKILNYYIEEWNGGLSLIYTMVFHANSKLSGKKFVDLFLFIMKSNNILIMESAKHPDLKDIHFKLVTNAFKVMPGLHEKQIHNSWYYEKNYKMLIEVYFKELCDEIIKLRRTNNAEIYKQMASIELKFLYHHSLSSSGAARDHFGGGFSKQKFLEDFFISLIFELIESDRAEELPTVFSMMLAIPDYYKNENVKVILSDKKQTSRKQHSIPSSNNLLSEDIIKGCLYAIVKANEIENYRAAGYLVKVVTGNASLDVLKEQIEAVYNDVKNKSNFDLITTNVHINSFSLEYCFKKTYLLFNLQFHLKKFDIITLNVIEKDDLGYLIEKLAERKKEFNLIALQDKEIKNFKMTIGITEEE